MTAKHPMIPFPVIVRAADGDIEAINQIVHHYSGFIASRSMRPMKDEYGNTHMVVDETLRRRMETRLIAKILSFEIRQNQLEIMLSCGSMDKLMLPRQSLPAY